MSSYNPSIGSQPDTRPNFNYPPPGSSVYPGSMTFNPSVPGMPSSYQPYPAIPAPSYPRSVSGRTTPFPMSGPGQPTIAPHSGSSGPSFGNPSSAHPSFRSPRTSFIPPNATSGITPSWVTLPSMPSHLSAPYIPTSSNAGFSPASLQPLDTSFLRYPTSMAVIPMPLSSFGISSFSQQPPSLSGRAHSVSFFSSGPQGTVPFRNHEVTVWTPPSLSSVRSPSLPLTLERVSGNFSFPQYHQTNSSTSDTQFRNSILRKLEETTKILHQMHASPERPFTTWQTMGLTPLAIRISPQTTLFVDPLNLSGVFQRVSSAQVQETRASQEGRLESIGRAIAIVISNDTHAITKYVGIFLKNTLLTIEQLNPNPRHLTDKKSLSQAWETEAVPAIHQWIDDAYGTHLGANYNPNNDGRVVQAIQNFVLDPLWLVPMGRLVEGVNLNLRGATVTFQEIGSAVKTARVALETPGAMKPALAIAGSSAMAKETKAAEVILSELKAGARAASLESKAVSGAGKMVKTEDAAAIYSHQLPQASSITNSGGWILPKEGGGAFINGRWYVEHALERMAPRTPQIMAELESRFLARAKVASQKLHPKEFHKWRLENAPNPRGVPPSVIEAEIAQPGSTGVRVILNENGHVITVIPGG